MEGSKVGRGDVEDGEGTMSFGEGYKHAPSKEVRRSCGGTFQIVENAFMTFGSVLHFQTNSA